MLVRADVRCVTCHLLVILAVVLVVHTVEVVPECLVAVSTSEALLVVAVRPGQDRLGPDDLQADLAFV